MDGWEIYTIVVMVVGVIGLLGIGVYVFAQESEPFKDFLKKVWYVIKRIWHFICLPFILLDRFGNFLDRISGGEVENKSDKEKTIDPDKDLPPKDHVRHTLKEDYGPNDYLKDRGIVNSEGRHSIAGRRALKRMAEYEKKAKRKK